MVLPTDPKNGLVSYMFVSLYTPFQAGIHYFDVTTQFAVCTLSIFSIHYTKKMGTSDDIIQKAHKILSADDECIYSYLYELKRRSI